jgi:hypothetical protein
MVAGVTLEALVAPLITSVAAIIGICLTAWFGVRAGRNRERADNDKVRAEEMSRKDAELANQFKNIRADQINVRMRMGNLELAHEDCLKNLIACRKENLRIGMEVGLLKAGLKTGPNSQVGP